MLCYPKKYFSELYLDGNSLECIGLIDIIQLIVDYAEQEYIYKKKEKDEEDKKNQLLEVKNSAVSTFKTTQEQSK